MPQGNKSSDLKGREYRDEKGEVHHHTHAYMERHKGEAGHAAGAAKSSSRTRSASAGSSRTAQGDASKASGAKRGGSKGGAQTTTDHGEIRTWAEAHGGRPAAVARTHKDGDVGIIRIMFPEAPNSEHSALEEISWEEFFQEFESRELALLYDADSLFSKIIGRDTVEKRERGENHAHR